MLRRIAMLGLLAAAALLPAGATQAVTIGFEGEANGQALAGNEFAGVTISSSDTGSTHLGPTIFDSSLPGPNDAGADPDLLVNLGNLLILQNTAFPTQSAATIFDTPNDEANYSPTGEGNLLFSFDNPVEVQTIDLVDLNGGAEVDITLTDVLGNTLVYEVPEMWTEDIADCGFTCDGFKTFDLQTLAAQAGETVLNAIAPAPVVTGPYDDSSVVSIAFRFHGSSPSAAIDNLSFVPEPGTGLLLALGVAVAAGSRRRAGSFSRS